MHRIVCDVSTGKITQIDLTAEEIAEIEARAAEYVPSPAPTKEQMLAELQALTAKIQALE
jgi:hypothetical protein